MGDLVVVTDEAELKEAVEYAKTNNKKIHILGGGTNTYFAEDLSSYLFIKPEFMGVELEGETLTAYAGEDWDDVVKYAVEKGLWGIENLSKIPGSAGAAPIQNIGAYGVELKDMMLSTRVFDLETMEISDLKTNECEFGYRDSLFKHKPNRFAIISVTMQLSKERKPVLTYAPLDTLAEDVTLGEVRNLVVKTREAKLPDWHEYPNTGSFFKNPIISKEKVDELKAKYPDIKIFEFGTAFKVSAAWLIEHVAGAKGKRVGNMGTWPNQPLVLVNYGDATAEELNTFAREIEDKIETITGVRLHKEVNFVQ